MDFSPLVSPYVFFLWNVYEIIIEKKSNCVWIYGDIHVLYKCNCYIPIWKILNIKKNVLQLLLHAYCYK